VGIEEEFCLGSRGPKLVRESQEYLGVYSHIEFIYCLCLPLLLQV